MVITKQSSIWKGKSMKVNYFQDKGVCLICGKTHKETSIWRIFEEVTWFRGEDEYLGKFCKECRKLKKYEKDNLFSRRANEVD